MSADRNMLFGFLAVQMDFIDREQLIAAMGAWVKNKTSPLGSILFDQGAIAEDTLSVLDSLVDKHLELHGSDAESSLGKLASIGQLREQIEQLGDPEVDATLAHVTAVDAMPGAELVEKADESVGNPSSSGRRFTILRPLAKGGLGKVSVAQDQELSREVALKEIQDRYSSDPACVSRFVLEAEVTGGLEHPGVVPVYGLGENSVGRPFYAMRLVRGDSLREAINHFFAEEGQRTGGQRVLQLRQLLNRFIDVCNAIEYAHSRGVLHRDLKPSNIMLGKYGETLVVDWGVAKAMGHSDDHLGSGESTLLPTAQLESSGTQVGAAIGTPQYMSPEQAAGQAELLGPASDVYSLGATLYCILVGVPPFEDHNASSVLRKVRAGDFDPPRKVSRQVPKPLDAICQKAMKNDPDRRYQSTRLLANDIEHWMADEPVSAYRESSAERLARWLRRHGMQASIGALVLLTLFLIGGELLVNRARWGVGGSSGEGQPQSRIDQIQTQLDQVTAEGRESRRQLAAARRQLGESLLATGSRTAARDAFREAVELRRQLTTEEPGGDEFFHLAVALAAMASVSQDGDTTSGGGRDDYQKQSLEALRAAVDAGWRNFPAIESNSHFDPIRILDGYKVLAEAAAR